MKDNLQLKKFKTEPVQGVYNIVEEKTFFCSKVMDIEDIVTISNSSVQYYQINKPDDTSFGYQYYIQNFSEELNILDIIKLKLNNHNISLLQQSIIDEENNTKWKLQIYAKTVLTEYLFAKIKEARTFKSMKYSNFINKNINKSIYDYITMNLLDRYAFKTADLYIYYIDIKDNNLYSNLTIKQYDPQFNSSIELPINLIKNINISQIDALDSLSDVIIEYSQIKPSTDYKFDYYFNLYFEKI